MSLPHQRATLGSVAKFINGVAFKPSDWEDNGRKIIRIQNLTDPSKPYNRTSREVDEKFIVRTGDILVSWSATLDVFEWREEEALLNQHIFKAVPNPKVVDKDYFKIAVREALRDMAKHTHGSTMKHVNRGDFIGAEIPLPPLATQQHIARVLEQADQLRKQAQQMESELKQLAQSLFLEMFGDPVTNPKGFSVVNIQEVVDIRDGTHDTPSYVEKGIPFVTSTHLRGDHIDFSMAPKITEADHRFFSKRSLVEDGDILFGMIGSVGNATLVKKDFEFSIKNVALFKPLHDKVSSYFLWMYLRNEKFLHHLFSTSGKGGNQKFVALGPLRGMELMLPPQELMADFATRLSAILERRRIAEGQTLMINDMFNSVMQRAFNGELTAPERKAA